MLQFEGEVIGPVSQATHVEHRQAEGTIEVIAGLEVQADAGNQITRAKDQRSVELRQLVQVFPWFQDLN